MVIKRTEQGFSFECSEPEARDLMFWVAEQKCRGGVSTGGFFLEALEIALVDKCEVVDSPLEVLR